METPPPPPPPPPPKKKIKKIVKMGIFLSGIGEKQTFWYWEWGLISAPKSGDREPWILMELPIHYDTISIGLSILLFKGSQVEIFVNYGVFLSLNSVLILSKQCRP